MDTINSLEAVMWVVIWRGGLFLVAVVPWIAFYLLYKIYKSVRVIERTLVTNDKDTELDKLAVLVEAKTSEVVPTGMSKHGFEVSEYHGAEAIPMKEKAYLVQTMQSVNHWDVFRFDALVKQYQTESKTVVTLAAIVSDSVSDRVKAVASTLGINLFDDDSKLLAEIFD